jgi:hypothetical protein
MKTWVRLLGILITGSALSLLTLYGLKCNEPERNTGANSSAKPVAELLIGKWEITKHGSAVAGNPGTKLEYEYTTNGRELIWVITSDGERQGPVENVYTLSGRTMRIESLEGGSNTPRAYDVAIESIDEESMTVSVAIKDGRVNRVVMRRLR